MNNTIGNITTLIEDLGIYAFIKHVCISCLSDFAKVLLFLVVAAIILGATFYFGLNPDLPDNKSRKRALIVATYPGDECLYFGPTILKLKTTCEIHLLLITEGSQSYLGRCKIELWDSCLNLGIPRENIRMMHITPGSNQDDPWNPLEMCRILLDHIVSMSFDEVYTMELGITRLPRQNNLFFGFAYMGLNDLIPTGCSIYILDSVNCIRKYSFFLDAFISYLSKYVFVIRISETRIIRDSIQMHKSRLIHHPNHLMYISRYVYINTYKLLNKDDLGLILQMPEDNIFNVN